MIPPTPALASDGDLIFAEDRGPISRVDVARFATTINDANLIHLDDGFAREAGFPGAIVHEPLVLGHLATLVTGWAGGHDRLARFSARLLAATPVGATVTCRGTVTGTRLASDGGQLVDVGVEASVGGTPVAAGEATVRIGPSPRVMSSKE